MLSSFEAVLHVVTNGAGAASTVTSRVAVPTLPDKSVQV